MLPEIGAGQFARGYRSLTDLYIRLGLTASGQDDVSGKPTRGGRFESASRASGDHARVTKGRGVRGEIYCAPTEYRARRIASESKVTPLIVSDQLKHVGFIGDSRKHQ